MKLEKEITNDIPVKDLPEATIAIITKWLPEYENLIVIRWTNTLFVINNPNIYWDNVNLQTESSRVRILQKGEKIIV